MALNSLNTNIAAIGARNNIAEANNASSASIARLASGDRIQRAADDVASLSAGTSLQTNVSTLRRALLNTAQGQTLLQVADGALAEITDILQRQKAIATQASAGSLTPDQRGFLNQEFQQLTQEVDRLARETNFNGVKLLDGSLFEATFLEQDIVQAMQATASLTFSANVADQKTVRLNGVVVEFDDAGDGAQSGGTLLVDTTAIAGGSIHQYVQALANALNDSMNTQLSGATYEATNETLVITSRFGGLVGEEYTVDAANSTATYATEGRRTNEANLFTLQGTTNQGIAAGDVRAVGVSGDSFVEPLNQQSAIATIDFTNSQYNPPTANDFPDGTTIIFDDGNVLPGPNVPLEFDTDGAVAASALAVDISNANNKLDVLDALVSAINTYEGVYTDGSTPFDDFLFRQFEARREGDRVVIETFDTGDLVDNSTGLPPITQPINAAAVNGAVVTGGAFQSGERGGVSTSGISNPDFTGILQGFTAQYNGQVNLVDFSLQVGTRIYTASSVDVSVATPPSQLVRFISGEGDYFDINLQQPTVNLPVNNQATADLLAVRLDKAFDDITFYQDRDIKSYIPSGDIVVNGEPIGSLTGSSVSLQLSDFRAARIDDVFVGEPLPNLTDGIIEITINDVVFRSMSGLGSRLGSNSVYQFISLENANDIITYRTGNINLTDTSGALVNYIDFGNEEHAIAFEEGLKRAFGIGEQSQTLDFQVGTQTLDKLDITIDTVTTERLYDDEALDVTTRESALRASAVLDEAINKIIAARAEVGGQMSRFDFASANIESSVQNQESARGLLLDTDIGIESTQFAVTQVQLQAGISVLAQANLIPQNLLKLVGDTQ